MRPNIKPRVPKPPKPKPSTALTVAPTGSQLVSFEDLADQGRKLGEASVSPKTLEDYQRCWRKFDNFCDAQNLPSMPADAGTLAGYITWLVGGQQGVKRGSTQYADGYIVSRSFLAQTRAALEYAHRRHGHSIKDLFVKSAALSAVWKGALRTTGQSRAIRRVDPITDEELRDMLEMGRPDVLREARDSAVLAVGFGACRRRSEVVGLDYQKRGTGRGTLTVNAEGITVKLMVSKTNQAGAEEDYIIPRRHAPLLCAMTEHWLKLGQIKPGDPVFPSLRHVGAGHSRKQQSGYLGIIWEEDRNGKGWWVARHPHKRGWDRYGRFASIEEAYAKQREITGIPEVAPWSYLIVPGSRMRGQAVAEVVKARYEAFLRAKHGKRLRPEQIEAIAAKKAKVSGHSMRVGHITSAAKNGRRPDQIQLMSGHKTQAMISVYTRPQKTIEESSLKGMKL